MGYIAELLQRGIKLSWKQAERFNAVTTRQSVPALGKPSPNPVFSCQAKKQEYQDSCARTAVEGIFETVRIAYGMACIMAHLQETAVCIIGVAFTGLPPAGSRFFAGVAE